MSLSFKQFGSLYFAQDLDKTSRLLVYTNRKGVEITDPRFAIGPSTGREFNEEGKDDHRV